MEITNHCDAEKSASTRRAQSSLLGSCHSRGWYVKLRRTSRPIFGSRATRCWLCKRQRRLTWLGCLKTLISVPFMPSALPSCPRISSLPGESGVRELKETKENETAEFDFVENNDTYWLCTNPFHTCLGLVKCY